MEPEVIENIPLDTVEELRALVDIKKSDDVFESPVGSSTSSEPTNQKSSVSSVTPLIRYTYQNQNSIHLKTHTILDSHTYISVPLLQGILFIK